MHSKLFSSIRVLPVQSALSFIDCRQRWEIEDGEEILAAGPLLHEQRSSAGVHQPPTAIPAAKPPNQIITSLVWFDLLGA